MAFVVIVIVEWLEMPRYMYLRQNIFTESTSEGEVMEIEVKKEYGQIGRLGCGCWPSVPRLYLNAVPSSCESDVETSVHLQLQLHSV
jgi:hypothetical protein